MSPFIKDVVHREDLAKLLQIILTALIVESSNRCADLSRHVKDVCWIDDGCITVNAIVKDKPNVRLIEIAIDVKYHAINEIIRCPGKFSQRRVTRKPWDRDFDMNHETCKISLALAITS